ncbi:MAG: HpsJ family protein [Phormidesmis sp.]
MNYIAGSAPRQFVEAPYGAKNICRIIGLVCITGFIFDMVMLVLPLQNSIEWRIGVIQEAANRSIILLFGLALLVFGSANVSRSTLLLASKLSMTVGVMFFLLCPLSIADSISLSRQSASAINAQESQIKTEIQAAKANPTQLPAGADVDSLKYASQQLTQQATSLRKSAKNTAIKTGTSNIGNLLIVGVGLLGLGRSGMDIARFRG